jgi:hypothetical protein
VGTGVSVLVERVWVRARARALVLVLVLVQVQVQVPAGLLPRLLWVRPRRRSRTCTTCCTRTLRRIGKPTRSSSHCCLALLRSGRCWK